MKTILQSALVTGMAFVAVATLTALPAAAQQPDGFLFKRPVGSIGIHFGYTVPGANSQVFDFVSEQLTIDPSDFQTVFVGAELALRTTDRLDLSLEMGVSESQTSSEFRDWVDGDDLPIEQVTTLRQVPLTLSAKMYLQDRGQSVGRLAWVPASWAPYVGGGAGVVWYDFQQNGDFVDFETLEVFNDFLQSDGSAFTAHGLAGVEVTLSPRVVLAAEGRYSWGEGDMGNDFVDFDPLDLSGFRGTVGFKLRF